MGEKSYYRHEKGLTAYKYSKALYFLLELSYLSGLKALFAFLYAKLDTISFVKIAIPSGLNGRIMNKYIFTTVVWGDETIPLRPIEPLDGAGYTICHSLFSPCSSTIL